MRLGRRSRWRGLLGLWFPGVKVSRAGVGREEGWRGIFYLGGESGWDGLGGDEGREGGDDKGA